MRQSIWHTAVLCGVLLTGAAALRAQNATSGGDQQPQPDAQNMAQQRGGPGGRRGGGIRGTVTAVNGNSVSLKTEAGEAWTVLSTENTRVRRDGQPSTLSAVQQGDEVMAMGMPDADKHEVHAMMVMDMSAAAVAKAKENLGKTYIAGRITAMHETQLTVMRSDRVSQVIALDETTSLHRGGRPSPESMAAAGMDMGGMMGMGGGMGRAGGQRRNADAGGPPPDSNGESITLADVKVGDTIVGTGSVKNGSFVPTDLHVMQRPAGGGRRGPGGDGEAPPPPQP